MADMTPPPSNSNTPNRPLDPAVSSSPIPASPTPTAASKPHPLSSANTHQQMEIDPSMSGPHSAHVFDPEDSTGSSDGEEVFDSGDDGIRVLGDDDDQAENGDQGGGAAGSGAGVSPGKTTQKAKGGGKKKGPRRAKAVWEGGKGKGKGKGKGDSELWEADIVARWNSDIGDVCRDPTTDDRN